MSLEAIAVKGVEIEFYCVICESSFTIRESGYDLYVYGDVDNVVRYWQGKHLEESHGGL